MRTLLFTFLIICSLPSVAGWKKFINIPNLQSIHYINQDLIVALNDTAIFWGNQFEEESWQSQKYDFNGYSLMELNSYFGRKHSAAYFSGLDYGIVLLEKEGQEGDRKLLKLTNQAQSFSELNLPAEAASKRIVDLDFFDNDHGMILLDSSFFVTDDGGQNWQKKEIPLEIIETSTFPYSVSLDPFYLNLYPNGKGFIVGFRGIMVTTDHGATWKPWYTDLITVKNKEFSGQTVPYDAYFYNDDIYLMASYSPFALNLTGLYKLNPEDTTLTQIKSTEDFNTGSIQFQHGIFFSPENYHFYNNLYLQQSDEIGLVPYMFSKKQGSFRPSMVQYVMASDASYLYDYSLDGKGHLFTDAEDFLIIYESSFCEQISLESIEQLSETSVRLHLNNQSGADLYYPGAYMSYWDNDTLKEIGSSILFWAGQGPDAYMDISPAEKISNNEIYDVVITNSFNAQHCAYTIQHNEIITGTDAPESEISLNIFPNPAANYLRIKGMENEKSQVSIIDQHGIIVLMKDFYPENGVDISNLSEGQYSITIQGTEKSFSGKFVKRN